jgi:hypothetical protein
MFKFLDLDSAEGLLKLYTKIFGTPDALPTDNADQSLIDKAKEFLTHQSDYRYCVLGHTHNPMQVPIRITSKGIEQMYESYSKLFLDLKQKAQLVAENRAKTLEEESHFWS